MGTLANEKYLCLESLISIFTIDKGQLKILLFKKAKEPFKGYWILPGGILENNNTLENNINNVIIDYTGLQNIHIEQCYTFSSINRNPDERIVATSFIGLIDSKSVEIQMLKNNDTEFKWFGINDIPKLGYDHNLIINKSIEYLKNKITNSNILRILFPSDFTLPELQRVYEQILEKKFDRRNFRKKFMNLGLIEDTNEKNTGSYGRPAKLYRFKEGINQINLF